MKNRKIIQIIVSGISIYSILILLDFFNISRFLPLDIKSINFEFLDLLTNGMIIIILYLITYYLIDSVNIKKEKNIQEIRNVLINETYKNIVNNIKSFEDEKYFDMMIKKINFNIPLITDEVYQRILTSTYIYKEEITKLAMDGYITSEEFQQFIDIENSFLTYLHLRITFFDAEKHKDNGIYIEIDIAKKRLLNLLKQN